MKPTPVSDELGCHLRKILDSCDVSAADIELFESTRSVRVSKRGAEIFCQHHPSTGAYCIRSGHVLLSSVDAFEHETAFKVAGPGEILGLRSLLGEEAHAASALALTACRVCWHAGSTIYHLINTYPSLTRRFLKVLARDRGASDGLLLRGHQLPLPIRLVNLLLILKDQYATGDADESLRYHLPLQRRDMAALLGTRVESVARAIKELERKGVANFRGRKVEVPDQDKLLELTRPDLPMAKEGIGSMPRY